MDEIEKEKQSEYGCFLLYRNYIDGENVKSTDFFGRNIMES